MLCFCTLQPRNSHQEGLDSSLYAVILVPQEMYPRLLCRSTYYNRLRVGKQRQRQSCVADNPEHPPVTLYIYLNRLFLYIFPHPSTFYPFPRPPYVGASSLSRATRYPCICAYHQALLFVLRAPLTTHDLYSSHSPVV